LADFNDLSKEGYLFYRQMRYLRMQGGSFVIQDSLTGWLPDSRTLKLTYFLINSLANNFLSYKNYCPID
jgi:hypothetical protein